jgi:hypothetical protein
VVGLVLGTPRQHPRADDLHRVAVLVEALGHDVLPALGVDVHPGDRQAALLALLLLFVRELEYRVDQVAHHVIHVEHEHPQPDADLRRGQAGALRVQQRLGQVTHQPAQLLVEVHHRVGGAAQHGVTKQTDRRNGHDA